MPRVATFDAPPRFSLKSYEDGRLRLVSDTGALALIEVLEHDILRFVMLPDGVWRHPKTWAIAPGQDDVPAEGRDRMELDGFQRPPASVVQTEDEVVVETAKLRLEVRLLGLRCRWLQKTGDAWRVIQEDRPTQAYDFGWWGGKPRHYVARRPGDRLFGLGEPAGPLDHSGRRIRLSNMDAMGYDARTSDPLYKHIPFLLVQNGAGGGFFGAFYDTLSDAVFDLGCEHSNYHGPYRYFAAEHGDLDLYVIAGPTAAEATRRFTWLTGRPAETPDWALSYSGSTMSYTDAPDAQARMGVFLDEIARHDMPCRSFHLSSGYTSIKNKRYVFHWNREKFPDPERFIADYQARDVRVIANIKPALLRDHPEFERLAEMGAFLSDAAGRPVLEQFWDDLGAYLDFTRPETRDWWREQVSVQLLQKGVAATWNDNNEYEVTQGASLAHGFGEPFRALEMKPLQTLLMLKTSREAQLAHAPEAPPFLVTRAGFAGLQRYAQTWSGDNYTSWASLKWNIRMGLSLALSGVSSSGHDIGGFAGPRPDAELFARWVGLGVFLPRFSIHSWNDDQTVNEPWMHEAVRDDIRQLMHFREAQIIPVLKQLLARYRHDYEPVTRPIFFDFPDDPHAYEEREEFMLGPDLLVAPVVEPGRTTLSVRLPVGASWRDGWSGEVFEGGAEVERPAPFARPPFFHRASAV